MVTGVGADVHALRDIDPDDPVNIFVLLAFELTHSIPQSFWLNASALKNIESMLVTLDTSHFERSLLNDDAEWNVQRMSVTLDTSHFERSPLNDLAL